MFAGLSNRNEKKLTPPRFKAFSVAASASELEMALARGEFGAVFQPYVSSETGEAVAIEATLRWHHPRRGSLAPSEFVCEADQYGLLERLTFELIDQAALAAATWWRKQSAQIEATRATPFVISLSGAMLRSSAADEHLASYVAPHDSASGHLVLELGALSGVGKIRKLNLDEYDDDRDSLTEAFERQSSTNTVVVAGVSTILQWYVASEKNTRFVQGDFICPPTAAANLGRALQEWKSSFRALSAC